MKTKPAPKSLPRKVYIKDGKRKMSTDSGYMHSPAGFNRKMFGKMRGGKYSYSQEPDAAQ